MFFLKVLFRYELGLGLEGSLSWYCLDGEAGKMDNSCLGEDS